jgi:tetratricopeptide (TPR) repeat protein
MAPAPAELDLPPGVSVDEYAAAKRRWEARFGRSAQPFDILANLADSFTAQEKLANAVACFDAIPTADPVYGLTARLEQAKLLIRLHRAADAEANLRELIDHVHEESRINPRQLVEALDLLRFLLEVELRFEERADILRVVHELGAAETFETLAYGFPSTLRWNGPQAVQWLETFWKADPGNIWLRVALGRYRTGEGRLDEARQILEQCRDEHPQSLTVGAAVIACYYEQNDWQSIRQVLEQLPPRSASDPWLLLRMRGHFHNREKQFAEAARCFEQALAGDPANAESLKGVAVAYEGLDRTEERAEALRKLQVMARLQSRLGSALSQEGEVAPLVEIIELCQEIDLHQQARLVAVLVLKIEPSNAVAKDLLAGLPPHDPP